MDARVASRAANRVPRAVNRINRAVDRKALGSRVGVPKAEDRRADGPTKAAGRHLPVRRSKAARRRAKAAAPPSPAKTVAAMAVRPSTPRPQGSGQGRPHEFKGKPKPLIPITDAMKKGKEPMRTFGDLMQFFGAATDDKKPPAQDDRERRKKQHDKREQDEREQVEKPGPAVTDAPAAETMPESGPAARREPRRCEPRLAARGAALARASGTRIAHPGRARA